MNERVASLVLLLLLCGCGIVKRVAAVPQKTIGVVVPGKGDAKTNPADLQQRLMSLADDATMRVATVVDQYAAQVGTREAGTEALLWKLSNATTMMQVATGPNPRANLVDALAITTLRRMELESLLAAKRLPETQTSLLELARIFESTTWKIAEDVLTVEQREELRGSIEAWHQQHPPALYLAVARPQEYALELRRQAQTESRPGSIKSLLTLDPLLGLDPAVREVTQTRLFAERAMYTLQRMPTLLRWQTELLTRQTLQLPEFQTLVTNATVLSASADRVSRTAAQLPDRLSTERERIMADLEAQEGKLRALAAEVREALAAGEGLSTALQKTLVTFDDLMKRFGVGEAKPPGTPAPTDRHSFDIRDYGSTAKEITTMAAQLDTTLKELAAALDSPALARGKQELGQMSVELQQRARATLNHAFGLAAGLIMLAFFCALAYRWIAARFFAPPAGASPHRDGAEHR